MSTKENEKKTADMEEIAATEEMETQTSEKSADEPKTEKRPAPCVYCGPTVRGVAKQYTVYSDRIPAALKRFIADHPEAGALVVGVENFAKMRKRMETAGTAENILYRKIKSEL